MFLTVAYYRVTSNRTACRSNLGSKPLSSKLDSPKPKPSSQPCLQHCGQSCHSASRRRRPRHPPRRRLPPTLGMFHEEVFTTFRRTSVDVPPHTLDHAHSQRFDVEFSPSHSSHGNQFAPWAPKCTDLPVASQGVHCRDSRHLSEVTNDQFKKHCNV